MAYTIPPPPYLTPPPPPLTTNLPPNYMQFFFLEWKAADNLWGTSPLLMNQPWDLWPTGYMLSPASTPAMPILIVVSARVRPDGSIAPNVLEYPNWVVVGTKGTNTPTGLSPDPQPPPPPAPSPQCPPGFIFMTMDQLGLDLPDWPSDNPLGNGLCIPVGPAWPAWSPQPKCPPGTVWDPTTETCKVPTQPPPIIPLQPPPPPNPPPTPPPQPPPPPPGTPPQPCYPDPNPGDELTNALNCIIENLNYLQYQLSQLPIGQPGQPENLDPVTCTQLTGLVTATNQSLLAIGQAIAAVNTGAPVDLSGVVGAIFQVVSALNAYPPIWQACCNAIVTQLTAIANNVKLTDVSGIVEKLQRLFDTLDVPKSVYDQLEADGYIPQGYSQLLSPGAVGSGAVTGTTTWWDQQWKKYRKWVEETSPPGIPPIKASPSPLANISLKNVFTDFLDDTDDLIEPILKDLIDSIVAQLKPPAGFKTTTGVIDVDPDKPVSSMVGVAMTASISSYLMEVAHLGGGEALAKMTEFISSVIGLEELRDVQIGPLLRNGIARIAEMQAKAIFQQELPGTTTLQTWVAQGLLSPARAKALSLLNGTSDELYPISQAGSYRGLNARQMLRLIETDIFSPQDIADELTFSAMRPASQARMLQAAPYLATASERSSLRSTLESAYVAGLLSDADLQSQVLAIEQNTDLGGLVLSRARLQKLIAETKALETEYTSLFIGGLMPDTVYRENLTALGLQPDMVNSIAARAEARANVTLHRKELAAAAQEAKALQKAIDTVALKNFADGNIDAAALAAALLASGVIPSQAAAMTDLAVLRKNGALRWIYGLQLAPSAATLLRDRVAALTDQRKRLQITDPVYVQQLQALGIPPKYVNALQAAADALISPKTAAFPIPVETT